MREMPAGTMLAFGAGYPRFKAEVVLDETEDFEFEPVGRVFCVHHSAAYIIEKVSTDAAGTDLLR